MGSQNNDIPKTLDSISNTVSGDGRKFVAELKSYLRNATLESGSGGGGTGGGGGGEVEGGVEQVANLLLSEINTTDNNGMPQNDLKVTFVTTGVTNYKQAQIWVKTNTTDFMQVGIAISNQYTISNATKGTRYTVKVVSVNTEGLTSSFEEAPVASLTVMGQTIVPPSPTQFFLTWNEDGVKWEWVCQENDYIDFFELRLDENVGVYDDMLLDRTRNHFSNVPPPARSGIGYLYVRNIFGTYSSAISHTFNKPVAMKPNAPTLEATLKGVVITMDALPSYYQGWKLNINGEEFKSYNRQFTYYQFSGTIEVEYCFYDYIGDGEWSDVATMEIKTGVDIDELPVIGYDSFDQTIKDAIDSAIAQTDINEQIQSDMDTASGGLQDNIDGVIENLNKNAVDSPFTSIKQTNDGLSVLSANVTEIGNKVETNATQITLTNEQLSGLVLKVDEVEGKTETNASSITQTAEELESLVYSQVETLDGKIATNASNITQTADSIRATITQEVETLDGKITANASQISQTDDEIRSLVNQEVTALSGRITSNTTSINQNAKNITLAVSRIDTAESNINQNVTAIQLTNDSITSVVTELNKDVENCSYSAISQLKSGIDLCVKDADLNGNEIVTRINLSDGGVTIDGKWVHITGDTVFDENVIVGGYIASDTIDTDHIKTNAVTTAKIATNAITADKINANSITTEKITDKSVTGVKIEDGAITATKIVDGAVSSTKIEGGAITTEHIQAGSIIGEHISAGAITAEKLFAGDIEMTGALALVGGAVRLNENGLQVSNDNGSYTKFDNTGMAFYDSQGNRFAGIGRFIMGAAKHGDYIRFNNPWDVVPNVMIIPTNMQVAAEGYTAANVFWNIFPSNVTVSGFNVNCYSTLGAGSNGIQILNNKFMNQSFNSGSRTGATTLTPLSGATKAIIYLTVMLAGLYVENTILNSFYIIAINANVNVYVDGVLVKTEIDIANEVSDYYYGVVGTQFLDFVFDVDVKENSVIKVEVVSRITRNYNANHSSQLARCEATITTVQYNVNTDTVLNAGECMFVATDGSTAAYSVE